MNDQSTKTVIVLGMHRSGTSMVSGVLTCLGIDLGEDSPGKQMSNPLGHFEDQGFLDLNQRILAAAGGSWYKPPDPHKVLAVKKQFSDEIIELIRARTKQHPQTVWGWKDPRTSLIMDLYSPFLEDPYILWCQRNPEAVADSLWKRNQLDRISSLALNEVYLNKINEFLSIHPEIPVFVLPYEEVTREPLSWILEIVDFLGLHPSMEQIEAAVGFVLPEEELIKKKILLRWKNLITLPLRAVRKAWRVFIGR